MTVRAKSGRKMPFVSCQLWSLNRWLRWTGWRFFVVVTEAHDDADEPLMIGLVFYGWSFIRDAYSQARDEK